MKNLLYYFLALTFVVFTACEKDEECNDLDTTLVGDWHITVFPIVSGDVEFRANGTLIDTDNTLLDPNIGGVSLDVKTYDVESDSTFSVRAESSINSAIFLEYDVKVNSFTCNDMSVTVNGINGTMERN